VNYLLDTNHWSYLQEQHPLVVSRLHQLSDEASLYMSVVSQGELLAGVEWAQGLRRKRRLLELYEQVVAIATAILPVTPQVAERYAQIYAQLRQKGRLIQTNDIWIAASALVYDMILVSADAHFRFIDGLTVEDWSQQEEP
jgi:predicted nucleic acid-binding protein